MVTACEEGLTLGDRNEIITQFWSVWQKLEKKLYSRCLKLMNGNVTEAEDALSEAKLKAFVQVQKFADQIKNLNAWLMQLTSNLCRDIIEKNSRGPAAVEDIEWVGDNGVLCTASAVATPMMVLEREEQYVVIRRAVESLPQGQRDIFVLHFYEGLEHEEIVERLGKSYDSVCSQLYKARQRLNTLLMGYFCDEEDLDRALEPKRKKSSTPKKRAKKGKIESQQQNASNPKVEQITENRGVHCTFPRGKHSDIQSVALCHNKLPECFPPTDGFASMQSTQNRELGWSPGSQENDLAQLATVSTAPDCVVDVSSTASQTLICRKLPYASNPHNCVSEIRVWSKPVDTLPVAGSPPNPPFQKGGFGGDPPQQMQTAPDKQNIQVIDRTGMVSASVTAGCSCTAEDVMAIGQVIVEPESYLDCTLWDAREPVGAASGELCEFGVLYSQFGVKDVKKSITPFTEVSSTAAIALISRRVEYASNPHDCLREIPNSETRVRAALLRTTNGCGQKHLVRGDPRGGPGVAFGYNICQVISQFAQECRSPLQWVPTAERAHKRSTGFDHTTNYELTFTGLTPSMTRRKKRGASLFGTGEAFGAYICRLLSSLYSPNASRCCAAALNAPTDGYANMQSTQNMCDRSGRTHVVPVRDIVGKNIKDVCEKGYQYLKVLGLFNGSSKFVNKYGNKSSWEMLARKCLILSGLFCASDNSELRTENSELNRKGSARASPLPTLPAIVEKQRIQFSEELGPQTADVSAASMTVPVTVAEKLSFFSGSVAFLAFVCEKIMDFCGKGIGRSRSHSPPGRVDKLTRPLGEEHDLETVTVKVGCAIAPVVVDRKLSDVSTVVGEDGAPMLKAILRKKEKYFWKARFRKETRKKSYE